MWQHGNNPIKILSSCREILNLVSPLALLVGSQVTVILYCVPLGA